MYDEEDFSFWLGIFVPIIWPETAHAAPMLSSRSDEDVWGFGMTTCVNTETCAYFLFDEDHPTYGELCGRPATREFMVFGSSFPVCSEHFEDAAKGASQLIASLDGCDTTFAN